MPEVDSPNQRLHDGLVDFPLRPDSAGEWERDTELIRARKAAKPGFNEGRAQVALQNAQARVRDYNRTVLAADTALRTEDERKRVAATRVVADIEQLDKQIVDFEAEEDDLANQFAQHASATGVPCTDPTPTGWKQAVTHHLMAPLRPQQRPADSSTWSKLLGGTADIICVIVIGWYVALTAGGVWGLIRWRDLDRFSWSLRVVFALVLFPVVIFVFGRVLQALAEGIEQCRARYRRFSPVEGSVQVPPPAPPAKPVLRTAVLAVFSTSALIALIVFTAHGGWLLYQQLAMKMTRTGQQAAPLSFGVFLLVGFAVECIYFAYKFNRGAREASEVVADKVQAYDSQVRAVEAQDAYDQFLRKNPDARQALDMGFRIERLRREKLQPALEQRQAKAGEWAKLEAPTLLDESTRVKLQAAQHTADTARMQLDEAITGQLSAEHAPRAASNGAVDHDYYRRAA